MSIYIILNKWEIKFGGRGIGGSGAWINDNTDRRETRALLELLRSTSGKHSRY